MDDPWMIMEPVAHHCILRKKSIPLIPYNYEQHKILVYQPFVLLLHKLGFHLPADANKLFVRIPEFWTSTMLMAIAEKLGPIQKSTIIKIYYLLMHWILIIIIDASFKMT
jgi:timeless protein